MLPLSVKPGFGSFARKEGYGSRPDGPTHEVVPCAHPLDRRQAVATLREDPMQNDRVVPGIAVVCVLCCTHQYTTEVRPA